MKQPIVHVIVDDRSADFAQWQGVLKGISAAAVRNGMKLSAISQSEMNKLPAGNDPVILTGTDLGFIRQAVQDLRAAGRRTVLAGLDAEQLGEEIPCATPSRRTETQQLVSYLYACGRQRIALVGFGANSVNDRFRYQAAMEAVAAHGMPITQRDTWLWHHDPTTCFRSFLTAAHQYDAVICPNDVISICFINTCATAGIRVPEALYVASFGDTRVGRLYTPSITTMTMDMSAVGEQAFAAWQFVRADASGHAVCKITVPSRIIVRESTAGQQPPTLPPPAPPLLDDQYYRNLVIAPLEAIERCLAHCDELDLRILAALMDGLSYEDVCEQLFLSSGSLRYRLGKIYQSLGVPTRKKMETMLRSQFGETNPFRRALDPEESR